MFVLEVLVLLLFRRLNSSNRGALTKYSKGTADSEKWMNGITNYPGPYVISFVLSLSLSRSLPHSVFVWCAWRPLSLSLCLSLSLSLSVSFSLSLLRSLFVSLSSTSEAESLASKLQITSGDKRPEEG